MGRGGRNIEEGVDTMAGTMSSDELMAFLLIPSDVIFSQLLMKGGFFWLKLSQEISQSWHF